MSTYVMRDARPRVWRVLALFWLALGMVAPSFAEDQEKDATPPQVRFDELTKKWEEAYKQWAEEMNGEEDAAVRDEIYSRRPGLEFLAEFKAIGVEAKGTELAAQCWMRVLTISADFEQKEDLTTALDTLMADHIESRKIAQLPTLLPRVEPILGAERVEKSLQTLIDKSPHKLIKAGSLFAMAQYSMEKGKPEHIERARQCFKRLVDDYGNLKSPMGGNYKDVCTGFLFELDHLQIGQEAPDFEATDENGVKFKLSDYRGKVVVVDFWGFW